MTSVPFPASNHYPLAETLEATMANFQYLLADAYSNSIRNHCLVAFYFNGGPQPQPLLAYRLTPRQSPLLAVVRSDPTGINIMRVINTESAIVEIKLYGGDIVFANGSSVHRFYNDEDQFGVSFEPQPISAMKIGFRLRNRVTMKKIPGTTTIFNILFIMPELVGSTSSELVEP